METHKETVSIDVVDKAIGEAEEEYARDGTLLDARNVFATLRRKHFR